MELKLLACGDAISTLFMKFFWKGIVDEPPFPILIAYIPFISAVNREVLSDGLYPFLSEV